MTTYGNNSGIAITSARVRNFRSLADIEVTFNDLTVLIGANNAGKTSFLDALFAAMGAGRKTISVDDVRLAPTESVATKAREVHLTRRHPSHKKRAGICLQLQLFSNNKWSE